MASTARVHVRLDERIEARAEKALAAMGLSVSDAVRVHLTRVAAEKALPFEVRVPNARTRAAMEETRRDKLRSARSAPELLAALKAEEIEDTTTVTRDHRSEKARRHGRKVDALLAWVVELHIGRPLFRACH